MRSIIRLFCRKETKREIEEFEKHEREKCPDEELQRLLKYNYIQVVDMPTMVEYDLGDNPFRSIEFKIVGACITTTRWGRDSRAKLPQTTIHKFLILHHPTRKVNSKPLEYRIKLEDLKIGTERR